MSIHRDGNKISILHVKKKYEQQLLALPNVVGVGIGLKGGNAVIKVFVSQKVPEAQLKQLEKIPDRLEGFETDVEVICYPVQED
ncbi:hypothetical protein J2S00_001702 [Caldalkalibacillus uzonensis]|uniref:Uncharacterized protein n=1 Tax=Caldalkalibacillus uzonensis TaxID=353224 RepID=A0ABU0CR65_9BACI|nr:hypothetical protein [Caldalkalibacillus uzonensis]MDQ0338916.1 hypothetical protein [Caldalkalibacillus uzonensis]